MNQKIIQIVTIQGDHATDRGLYALTDAGNLYCIGSDNQWVKLPDLPDLPASTTEDIANNTAFLIGARWAKKKGVEGRLENPYPFGSYPYSDWQKGFASVYPNAYVGL